MNPLQVRINILRNQITRAKESGATHNACGMPMSEQIADWERLIAKAKRDIKS